MTLYHIDAFTENKFSGNPAVVIPLEHWMDEDLMQKIAMENNQPETVFFVPNKDQYEIRWFTPTVEVDLCGHATLASAYVLFTILGHPTDEIEFFSHRSGILKVRKNDTGLMTLNFPTDVFHEVPMLDGMMEAFGHQPKEAFKGKTDYMLVFDNEDQIRNMKPDMRKVAAIQCRGVIVTAKGNDVDFVSRFFGPQSGGDEDPVTGSAHTTLTPYWSKVLGKNDHVALQVSPRGGKLILKNLGERIEISGYATLYMTGNLC